MGGIVAIDFRDRDNPVHHSVDFDFAGAGYALCIIDTGAEHAESHLSDLSEAAASQGNRRNYCQMIM